MENYTAFAIFHSNNLLQHKLSLNNCDMLNRPQKKQRCEDCPLVKLLETTNELNRQLSVQAQKALYVKLLSFEKHNLN